MDQGELNKFVGEKMRQLAKRMADPRHPLHNRVEWRDGRPVMPDDDDELAWLVLAALDEPGLQ